MGAARARARRTRRRAAHLVLGLLRVQHVLHHEREALARPHDLALPEPAIDDQVLVGRHFLARGARRSLRLWMARAAFFREPKKRTNLQQIPHRPDV
jgi:hypothetical protein